MRQVYSCLLLVFFLLFITAPAMCGVAGGAPGGNDASVVPAAAKAPDDRAGANVKPRAVAGLAAVVKNSPPPATDLSARNAKPASAVDASSTAAAPTKSTPAAKANPLPPMTIVVTATRIPQPIGEIGQTATVVTHRQIEAHQLESVTDALRQVPGVQLTQSGSPGTIADVSIRGSTAAQTLIMIDGVPVNDSATDSFDVSRLTTGGLSQIEVVRGAGGALYGSQAIGGVINLLTREGSGPPKFSLLSEGGNRATQLQAATFDGAEGKLAYSGALSYFSTTGFRKINDNSDNLAGALRLDYHLDENTTVRGFARYIRANVGLPSFSIVSGIPLNPNAHQRNEFMLYKGVIDRRFGDRLSAHLSAFYVRDVLRLNTVPFEGNPVSESDDIPDETRGANLEAVYTWARGVRSLVGFDFFDRWVHSIDDFTSFSPTAPRVSRFVTVFNARRQEYAGYVEQEARLFDGGLIGTGGFRVDGNSNFGEEVSPAWSVAIPLARYGTTLRGSYSEGFRAPSFDELFFPGFGNPNLNPELSSEYDGGFTKDFGELASLTATYFSRRVHSQIVTVLCKVGPGCQFGATDGNAGRVDTEGVEIVPMMRPLRGLQMGGSVTILDETHASPRPSERPLRVPKYSATGLAEYTHGSLLRGEDQALVALAYTFVGDRDDITPASTIANHAAYHRFDLALTYSPGIRWRPVRSEALVVRIQNLLDRHYSEAFGFPAPPVNVVAGIRLDF